MFYEGLRCSVVLLSAVKHQRQAKLLPPLHQPFRELRSCFLRFLYRLKRRLHQNDLEAGAYEFISYCRSSQVSYPCDDLAGP